MFDNRSLCIVVPIVDSLLRQNQTDVGQHHGVAFEHLLKLERSRAKHACHPNVVLVVAANFRPTHSCRIPRLLVLVVLDHVNSSHLLVPMHDRDQEKIHPNQRNIGFVLEANFQNQVHVVVLLQDFALHLDRLLLLLLDCVLRPVVVLVLHS